MKFKSIRNGNMSTTEFVLDDVYAIIRELFPGLHLGLDSISYPTAVIVMAAGLVVGPRVNLLVEATGYSTKVVAGIARRMRACGLWDDDEVFTDEWFTDEEIKGIAICFHCMVAEGLLKVVCSDDGQPAYCHQTESESQKPN